MSLNINEQLKSRQKKSRNLLDFDLRIDSVEKDDVLQLEKIKESEKSFNEKIKLIYRESTDIIEKVKQANIYSKAKEDDNGEKIYAIQMLDELSMVKDSLFKVPEYIVIPMAVPVQFAIQEAPKYLAIKHLFKSIDQCQDFD